ncbi:hypothetical protein INR49_021776, partial [Caranx melampygus]
MLCQDMTDSCAKAALSDVGLANQHTCGRLSVRSQDISAGGGGLLKPEWASQQSVGLDHVDLGTVACV